MTTDWESVALRWVAIRLRGHHCPECGRQWLTKASTAVLMHECHPAPTNRRRWTMPPVRDTRDDLMTEVGRALADAVDDDALLREVDE